MANAMQCLEYGIEAFQDKYVNDAVFWFEKALEKNPDLPAAHIYLGRCYAVQLAVDEAIKHFERARQLDTNNAEVQYWIELVNERKYLITEHRDLFRRTFWIEKNDANGHSELESVFAKHQIRREATEEPRIALENAAIYNNLGVTYGRKGYLDESIEAFNKAITIQPDYARAYNNLGNAYQQKGYLRYLNKAIEAYNDAIRIQPDYAAAHYNLGAAYSKKGELGKSIEAYNKAIAIQPNNAEAHNNLGNAYSKKGDLDKSIEAYNKAIQAYSKAIAIQPDYVDAHYNLGLTYGKKGDPDRAIEAYNKAIAIQPDLAIAYSDLGLVYMQKGDLNEAVKACSKAITIQPNNAVAHNNLGAIYIQKRDLDKAIEAYSKAIIIQPYLAIAYNNLGNAYEEKWDLDKAIEACNNAIRIQPSYAAPHYNLGNVYSKKGDLDKSIEAYKNAIAIQPDYAEAYSNLGNVYRGKRLSEKAVECWQEALRLDCRQPHPKTNLALNYSERGMVKEALELLADATSHPRIHFTLGMICYNQVSDPDVLFSLDKRRQWLDRALDAFDRTLEPLDDIPSSILSLARAAIFWINAKLCRDGMGTVSQIAERLAPYFPDHPGHLLFANLAGLLLHLVEMLHDMCLKDAESAQQYLETIFRNWNLSDSSKGDHIGQEALDGLKQLSTKYGNLDSTWTYLEETQNRELMDSGDRDDHPLPLKNLLDEVEMLVREWVEDIANQRFLPPSLDTGILERIYQERINIFERELQECGGLAPDIVRAIYGRSLEAIYEECLLTPGSRDGLTNLRHTLGPSFRRIYDKASGLFVLDRELSEQAKHRIDDVEEELSSIRQKIQTLLQTMLKPIEFRTSEIIDSLPGGSAERPVAVVKEAKGSKGERIYGTQTIAVTIFSNIISNAQEHLERHGGDPDQKGKGRIETHISGHYKHFVTVSVIDNGKGIPQEVIDALERGEDSVISEKTGPTHGSGLVIVRDLLRSIGGQLRIRRLPRGGTMMKVRLPRHFGTGYELIQSEPAQAIGIEAYSMGSELSPKALRVLVVDDSPGWLKRCAEFLTAHGVYVITAEDTQSAERIFRQMRPQLVLVDVMLRYGKEGFTLLDRYREINPNCKVILMTREIDKEDEAVAFQKGVAGYLDKRDEVNFFKRLAEALSS